MTTERRHLESVDGIWARRISWGIVALAALIAFVHFAGGRVLWVDEAMIALNLRDLSWKQVVTRLEYAQMAPIGWLLGQKALLELTGNLEYSLRIVSFLAWIGCLFLFRDLCFRRFSPFVAACGLALFAFSAVLLKYAVELKHYEIDVLVATASLWAAMNILSAGRRAWGSWIVFAIAALFGVFFSFGGLFAIAGSGLAILVQSLKSGRRDGVLLLGAIGILCSLIFAWLMLSFYRSMVAGSGLTEGGNDAFFNRTSYMPLPTSLEDLLWLPRWIWDFFLYAFTAGSRIGVTILIGIGVLAIARRQRELLFVTVGPLGVGLLASSVHAYPMFERLALFALPGLFLAATFAIAWITEKLSGHRMMPLALLPTALIGPLGDIAYSMRLSPPYANQDIRPVMEALEREISPDDSIYVAGLAIPAWLLYRGHYGLQNHVWTAGHGDVVSWPCMVRGMPDLIPGQTAWFVVIQNRTELAEDGFADSLALLGLVAKHEILAATDGATLHRLRLSGQGRPLSALPDAECRT